MKNLIAIIAIAAMGIMTSCGGGNSCNQERIEEFSANFTSATINYAFSQSDENCKAYRAALEDYIDLVEDCDEIEDNDIDELKDALSDLEC